ncbi:tRNA glutamyl-Q(34) synthetase GluQRS [Alkalimarinus sediminis]|uniref:Glutamyl-Q tRNA(Asp) synthetase n=1 Tax=Alkalimarinus sediminis TaxID=1632866 RepID=A0A9E8HTB0_9ALTE|nr:tRNA glutamyl-Q(34) synthetase GluQRS [Alkalimarinus sediminis]UZW75359.1 tRNA glutamyl-Q(34) synthetase GluQRS [Alkalimarinus sediminis]
MNHPHSIYRGRFAPSPTGPLHFGSLVAALASFLDARHNNGQWLVRIEDIDPLREVPGASSDILHTLESHHLCWDETICYQSQRSSAYELTIDQLKAKGHTYYCPCSRKTLTTNQGVHSPECNPAAPSKLLPCATRFRATNHRFHWHDLLLGPQSYLASEQSDDFVIKRKEGFYAYQLAVVCDDIEQNITHIVRGSDLLDSTPPQLALYDALTVKPPQFGHIPVILNSSGQKLSKQNLAPSINNSQVSQNLKQALSALNQPLPQALCNAPAEEIINWAITNWSLALVPKRHSLQGGWLTGSEL